MTIKNTLFLKQKTLYLTKKEIEIDVRQAKIKVSNQSPFKTEELMIDIDRVHPNPQKIRKWAFVWLFLAIILSIYFLLSVSAFFIHTPLSFKNYFFSLIRQSTLLIAAFLCGWRYIANSFNLTIFVDRFTNLPLFSLFTNKPEPKSYSEFLELLAKIILNQEQTRTIRSILHDIPTHILIDEFSTSFLEELVRRGLDVNALLSFLQKRALNSQEPNDRPSLQ